MRGKTYSNFLYLSVFVKGYGIPIYFKIIPDKKGHSSVEDRKELLNNFINQFGRNRIKYVVADREFDGSEWLNYLKDIVHGAKQFAEYFMSTTREVFSPKVEHKYVRQLQENAVEVLKYIKKVGKDLDNKDPHNIEALTEEAQKIERKINSRTSFTQKQMKDIIDNLIELYKDAKKVAKESGSRASRHLTAAQNLENLAKEIYTSPSR